MKQIAILPEVIDHIVVDTSGKNPRYIAVSHSRKHMRISPLAYDLLERVSTGSSFATIAQEMSSEGKGALTAEEAQHAYERVVDKISKIGSDQVVRPKDFWFKLPLITATGVQLVATQLTFMFHPFVVFTVLSSLSLLVAYTMTHGLFRTILANPALVILAYLLFLLSLLAHEFGHASACAKGGVKPSEIGAAVYLFFPVFYSDVSSSWQLSRWQKVRVDIGGIYFQLCMGGIYLFLFIITKQAVFQWAVFLLLSSCMLSLNPLMKFDGYWILTDILDVSNLYKQPVYLLVYFYNALLKKPQQTLRWSKGVCIAILVYGVLRTMLWTYVFIVFLPFLYKTVINYPDLFTSTMEHLPYDKGATLMVDLQGLVVNAFVIILYGGGFCRIFFPVLKSLFPNVTLFFQTRKAHT